MSEKLTKAGSARGSVQAEPGLPAANHEAAPSATGEVAPEDSLGPCYVCGAPSIDFIWDETSDLPCCAKHKEDDQ